jgi:hypothetical protein
MTPDEVRAIVREELQTALKVLQTQADRYPDYDSDTIEDKAARMLERVAERTADLLRHTPACTLRRNDGAYWSDCDCGVEEER